jgi:pimeloyl-ACP methyl ester carboxylesterase
MASWEPHQALLAGHRKVVRAQPLSVQYGLDARRLPAGYGVAMEADALGRAFDDLGFVEPVDVVAWSYGAEITLDFAMRNPARIRTLTLIEPPAFWVLDATGTADAETRRQSDEMRALYASVRGNDVTADQLASFAHQAGFVPQETVPQATPMWPSWFEHRRSLLTDDACWRATGTRAALAALAMPVLLFKGTGSRHFLHRVIDGLASALPNARVVELPGGHAPQLASREQFLAELAALTGN